MKKIFFSLIFLSLVFTGCSLFETPEFVEEKSKEIDVFSEGDDFLSPTPTLTFKSGSGENVSTKILKEKDKRINLLETEVVKLKKSIRSLQATLSSVENLTLSHQDILERADQGEFRFTRCGSLAGFEAYDWYDSFGSLLDSQKFVLFKDPKAVLVNPDRIISGCYSANGNIAVFLVEGDSTGQSFGAIRYDTEYNSAQSATITTHDKMFLSTPQEFGKRKGNVIHLSGASSEKDCTNMMYFDYDFIKNNLALKKECAKCTGKDEECKEYQ